MAADDCVLEARNISKVFGGTTALSGVDFGLERGRVHALIGENGAGKSTLANILAGVHRPSSGRLLLDGREIELASTLDAAARGIALIHQELQLFPGLSVADNVFMAQERLSRWRTVDRAAQQRLARETLATLGQRVDPGTLVGSLPLGVQQIVEIARALVRETRVILMDEPTSALSPAEVDALFGVIRGLAARGVSIVYISHRLGELLAVADTVTILRDGRVVGAASATAVDVPWIVERMTGRALSGARTPDVDVLPGRPLLSVRNLSLAPAPGRAALRGISFDLHEGEVIGVYGSMGSGRTELVESLMGLHQGATGAVALGGDRVDRLPPDGRAAVGFAIVPEDRQRSGLVPTLSVMQNMTLASLHRLGRLGCLSPSRERQATQQLAADVQLKAPSIDAPVTALSGGNQQKVVIARALMSGPRVLLMDEPSRGVDVGARADILRGMRRLAASGMGIVFTSSDLDELLTVSTKVLALSRGRLTAEFSAAEATEAAIAAAASGRVDPQKMGDPCPPPTIH